MLDKWREAVYCGVAAVLSLSYLLSQPPRGVLYGCRVAVLLSPFRHKNREKYHIEVSFGRQFALANQIGRLNTKFFAIDFIPQKDIDSVGPSWMHSIVKVESRRSWQRMRQPFQM